MNKAMTAFERKLHDHLHHLAIQSDCELTKDVAKILLDQGSDDLSCFLSDLFQHGCISGLVGPLIYYADTHEFYDRNYADIEQLREQWEEEFGAPLVPEGDLKNFFAWFAFEVVAHRIYCEVDQ